MSLDFDCTVAKVQTLADGGIRVTMDLPEQATEVAMRLMNLRGFALRAKVEQTKEKRKRKSVLESLVDAEAEVLKDLS